MTRLSGFTIDDLEDCNRQLRVIGAGAATMGEVAQRITDALFERLCDDRTHQEPVTVSLHKSHPMRALPLDLHALVRATDPSIEDDDPCLVPMSASPDHSGRLLGSSPPLTARTWTSQPALASIASAMGIDLAVLPDPITAIKAGLHTRLLDGLFVEAVRTSGALSGPGRAELDAAGVQSAIGIGGWLPSGNVFLLLVLARVPIPPRSARLLRSLTPAIRASLTPFTHRPFEYGDAG